MLKITCNYEDKDYLVLDESDYCEYEKEIEISIFEEGKEEAYIYLNKEKSLELGKKLIEFAKGDK